MQPTMKLRFVERTEKQWDAATDRCQVYIHQNEMLTSMLGVTTTERDEALKSYLATSELLKQCAAERDMLVEALKLIQWSNDRQWIENCANEALTKVKK
jgi:hypothetical protein